MGNDNHRNPVLLQLQHDFQKLRRLLIVQSRRRLIQNQQFHILGHSLGNLDELLFAHTQGVDRHIDILAFQSDLRQHLRRFRSGPRPVDDPLGRTLFIPQEHVLRHRHVRA